MEELRLKLIKACNESGLPLEAIVFVIRDVYRDVSETYERMLKEQKTTASKEETSDGE